MTRRAFTLMEMLLVVAIISVLTGIVYAAFGPSRESARERVCVSNLHQIGQAFALYIADYEGIEPVKGVPVLHQSLGLPDSSDATRSFFKNYVKDQNLQRCPSYHDPDISRKNSTYLWPGLMYADSVPELNLPAIIAQRGSDYVLTACDQHNGDLDFESQPRWATKKVLVLRLNQQVQMRHIPARQFGAHTW